MVPKDWRFEGLVVKNLKVQRFEDRTFKVKDRRAEDQRFGGSEGMRFMGRMSKWSRFDVWRSRETGVGGLMV